MLNTLIRPSIFKSRCQILRHLNSSSVNAFTERTHTCGELTKNHIGKRVKLYGWLQKSSFNNKIIVLKDSYGAIQCVLNKSITADYDIIRKKTFHIDSIVKISGLVRERPEGQINRNVSTGDIEVMSDKLEIINPANANLPIQPKDHDLKQQHRLKYRYLDLRRPDMQEALRFKSQFCHILRDRMVRFGFVDCETPTLFNRTPGGANEFIVPTQEPKKYYNLVQSPQQLKQLLMVGAIDRYFQICKCYRDETTRPDRQPEFTQVDIELSFTNQESVMTLIEQLLHHIFSKMVESKQYRGKPYLSSFNDAHRLPRMSFADAFKYYGSDKPDTRFEWKIQDRDRHLVIEVPLELNIESFNGFVQNCNDKLKSDVASSFKLGSNTNNMSVIETVDKSDKSREVLGTIRVLIAKELTNSGHKIYSSDYSFTWVTDFPLFTKNGPGSWEPNHHPFTAPSLESLPLLKTDVGKVIGQHYDLVLNGQEIAGGSIRIHDAELQKDIFKILDVDCSLFSYFIEALNAGCPPHGGIAIGLDRLVASLLGRESIRETIAFPKSGLGKDLMTDTPQELDEEVLKLYHQKIN